ncbi:MAG: Wzz/FepE/Etk N-terminal domain-containing protein [Candidatus Methylacidiphilales bacterium]
MSEDKRTYYFELVDVVKFLIKYKKPLSIISIGAAIAAIIFTSPWFIKPLYQSTAIFYPSTNNSISSALLADTRSKSKDPLEFGEQTTAQQFIQMLESDNLKNRVIHNFNLREHYKIKEDDSEKNYKLGNLYKKYIAVRKTPFASIEVNVLDEDPNKAAEIANGIVLLLDSVKTDVQRRVALQALAIIEQQYKNKEAEVNNIKQTMRDLGAKGVYSFEEQSKAITELAGKGGNQAYITKQQASLAQYGSEALSSQETLVLELDKLSELRKKLEQANVDVSANLSNVFILQQATPAEKKAYPIRGIIVIVSVFGSFVLGCIVLLFTEKIRQININA